MLMFVLGTIAGHFDCLLRWQMLIFYTTLFYALCNPDVLFSYMTFCSLTSYRAHFVIHFATCEALHLSNWRSISYVIGLSCMPFIRRKLVCPYYWFVCSIGLVLYGQPVVFDILETSVWLFRYSVVWNTHQLIQRFCSCYTYHSWENRLAYNAT